MGTITTSVRATGKCTVCGQKGWKDLTVTGEKGLQTTVSGNAYCGVVGCKGHVPLTWQGILR